MISLILMLIFVFYMLIMVSSIIFNILSFILYPFIKLFGRRKRGK